MEQRLIDANAIPYRDYLGDDEPRVYKSQVDNLPTIDPVKNGKWIIDKSFIPFVSTCSNCGHISFVDGMWESNYCPSCGARMDGENEP